MESIIITEKDNDNSSISYSHPIIDERGVLENSKSAWNEIREHVSRLGTCSITFMFICHEPMIRIIFG